MALSGVGTQGFLPRHQDQNDYSAFVIF